jgi:hypothetical protein
LGNRRLKKRDNFIFASFGCFEFELNSDGLNTHNNLRALAMIGLNVQLNGTLQHTLIVAKSQVIG